nr:hypothetical protein [Tanacetum cinerariifolium]
YEQEPSYNQNYDDNYYPHESPSFPCCDYCGESHETFQCQPDNQNVDFSCSDQIQTLQYPDVNPPSPEISNEENFQAKGDLMKSIQTFLESFNCIPFEEKPQILFQTWETFFAIQCSQLEDSLSMGYEHLSITPKTESDEVTKSNAENLLPIPSECEVTSKDKRECDELVCDNHSDTFSDSKVDDDISVYDNDFEDIEYVEASVLDPKIVSIEEENGEEEENVVQREEEEVDLEDISQVQDVVLREKLFSITCLISNIEYLNDNSTPDCVFNSFESDNSLLDNFSPEFETFCDNSEETRSGNTTHANYSLPEYDSFCFEVEPDQERLINLVKNDNSDSSNDPLFEEAKLFLDDNSIPPGIENVADDPEGDIQPPDGNFDLEPEVISAVMEDIDESDEHFNPGGEIFVSANNEDVDYFPFMFVIRIFLPYLILPEISSLLLSAESEDTIFDPGISE